MTAGELVLDLSLYPRSQVSEGHVGRLATALRAGAVFPPVVIDAGSKRVVDGFHRTSAIIRVRGVEADIDVDERTYATEQEFLLDCIRLNAAHGLPMTPFDATKSLTLAEGLGVPRELTAAALAMTLECADRLMRVKTGIGENGLPVPLKPMAMHLRERAVSPSQEAAMKQAGGMKIPFLCQQITLAIDSDFVTDATRSHLLALRDKLTAFLP